MFLSAVPGHFAGLLFKLGLELEQCPCSLMECSLQTVLARLPCLILVDLMLYLWLFLNEHIPFSVFLQIKDILKPEVMEEIMLETRQRLLEQEG